MPLDLVHVNEQTPEVAAACPTRPCVVAHTDEGVVPLLGPREIDACAGSPDAFVAAVNRALAERG